MRRLAKITLEYTKSEIDKIILSHISESEKVSVESVEFKDDKYILHCVEGINTTIVPNLTILNTDKVKSVIGRKTGLTKAVSEILTNGVLCSLSSLVEQLSLKGIKVDEKYLKTYLLYKSNNKYIQVEPNIFKLKVNE